MCFARIVVLFRRISWRNSLDGQFPSACGSWAEAKGCTRVVLDQSGCVRAESIPQDNTIIIDTVLDKPLNNQISLCVDEIPGGKLMSPKDLSKSNTHGNLIHISVNSAIMGFIDDMYMITEVYTNPVTGKSQRLISLQS